MMQNKNCPECGDFFRGKRCRCGWKDLCAHKHEVLPSRCSYKVDGHRCPQIGTVSPGRNGEWFCSEHWQLAG